MVLLPGEYIYIAQEVTLTSWGIYIYAPGSQLTSISSLPLTPPYAKGGEAAGFTESEAEVAFEEIAAIL